MLGVYGIAIDTDLAREASVFELLLGTAMACVTQRLERAIEEAVSIAVVWVNVVCDLSRDNDTMVKAIDTKRMHSEVGTSTSDPSLRIIVSALRLAVVHQRSTLLVLSYAMAQALSSGGSLTCNGSSPLDRSEYNHDQHDNKR
jgi:hypothetical protein